LAELTDPSNPPNRDLQAHWDSAYERRGFSGVSWFQSEPAVSLDLIAQAGISRDAAVIDVGGGASPLVDRLVGQGFADISVLDVSSVALDEARRRLPSDAPVEWIMQDVLSWRPPRRYQLWHDRAVFHFMVSAAAASAYRDTLRSAVSQNGLVVIGTFASDGPKSCSGLPVARFSESDLAGALGDGFTVVATRREEHRTPSGSTQPFSWVCARAG
jgi:hypothetical protein